MTSADTAADGLVYFDGATIARPGGTALFRALNWTIRDGETWAVVGPVGSGKTALAEALLGRLHLLEGEIGWPFLDRLRAAGRSIGWPSEVIQRVSFKEESRLFSYGQHYYQQRFNFIEPADDLSLDNFLRSGTSASDAELRELAEALGIEALRPLSLIKLSNGQIRRARLVRALLTKPELLILDEPFMGLDAAGRQEITALLGDLIRQGKRLLLITRPETLPDWVTHVLELDHLAVRWQGPRSRFVEQVSNLFQRPEQVGNLFYKASAPTAPALIEMRLVEQVSNLFQRPEQVGNLFYKASAPTAPALIEMQNVNIAYDGKPILKDITWTVRSGERWAVLGPNGSGKSTLLSLICGDHPQAYSNDIRLFGQQRGSGETIWDIKRNIGLVSPELHLYFSEPLTAHQTAATGFFDVLAQRRTTPEQDAIVRELFGHFEMTALADRYFARLSTGEQRLVLLVRALVKGPPVLILDEPFQGLDSRIISRLRDWLDQRLRPDQTLIFVSHYAEEIPRTVTQYLRLEEGCAV